MRIACLTCRQKTRSHAVPALAVISPQGQVISFGGDPGHDGKMP